MKRLVILAALAIFASGCSTMTVTTYDPETGKIQKVENISTDVVGSIVQATKDKTLVTWKSGWAAYITASPGTMDDPTPTGKIFAGKVDEGYISIHKDHKGQDINWAGIAEVVTATNKSLNVSMSGVGETPAAPAEVK